LAKVQPVRVPQTLPVVLSQDEVARLLAAVTNLKHHTALSLAYGTGLRASEVSGLKVTDIDSQRMTLRARLASRPSSRAQGWCQARRALHVARLTTCLPQTAYPQSRGFRECSNSDRVIFN
jgi:integrase